MIIDNQHKTVITLICLTNIAISFNNGAIAASIPVIAHDLGFEVLEIARLVPFYMVPYGVGALLYAPMSRVVSYRVILMAAMAVYALFSFISGVSHQLSQILLAQVFCGIAAACSTPMSLMIIGELFDKDIRGRLIGIYFGTSFMASTVGMLCMGLMDWHWLFIIPAFLGLAAFGGLLFLDSRQLLERKHDESVNYWEILQKANIKAVFVYIFVMSFLYHALHKWYGVYLYSEYGLGKQAVSWILIIAALCGLSGQQIGGFLSDKKGRAVSCYAGIVILSLATVLLAGHYPVWVVPCILGLIAMGWTINHNAVSAVLTDLPDCDRPAVASLNSAVRFFSGGVGFAVSKFFVEKSFSLTFLSIGILMFAASLWIKYFMPQRV